MMAKRKKTYEYDANAIVGPQHTWSVVGARIGLHFWIRDSGPEMAEKHGEDMRYHGGVEVHYRSPPSYMKDDAPSHTDCWLLKAPCWHDGSSLAATERWIPAWKVAPNDHDGILNMLEKELEEREAELDE